jgi:hypothetical protein
MDHLRKLEPIYDRLRRMTPGAWQVTPSPGADPAWHIVCEGRVLPPGPDDVAFVTHAAGDIATLAAALEETSDEYNRQVASPEWLDRWREQTQAGLEDLCRMLGRDADHVDIEVLSSAVEHLVARVRDQEAAIRAARLQPKSDEAVQALSRVLRQYK